MNAGEMHDLKVRAEPSAWCRGVQVLIVGRIGPKRVVARRLEFVEEDDNPAVAIEPTFHLRLEAAQTLMDDLWACGIRPTEGKGSAGALAATERHLEDMRKIAFRVLWGQGEE